MYDCRGAMIDFSYRLLLLIDNAPVFQHLPVLAKLLISALPPLLFLPANSCLIRHLYRSLCFQKGP